MRVLRYGSATPLLSAVLCLFLLAPATAQGPTNLARTATLTSSSDWDDTTYIASMANDGDEGTRWNSAGSETSGAWLAAEWSSPQTINRVVIRQIFDRIEQYEIQAWDAAASDWSTVYTSVDRLSALTTIENPVLVACFQPALNTTGIRFVATQATNTPSISEFEAYGGAPVGKLQGNVKSAEGPALEGATVVAGDFYAVTDAQGNYSLILDAGTYDVTASKGLDFFASTTSGSVVAADGTTTVDFSLTVRPRNLARIGTASSSSDYSEDYDAAKAIDGDPLTRWNSAGGDLDGSWLAVEWPTAQTFNRVVVRQHLNRINQFEIQVADASGIWSTVYTSEDDLTLNAPVADPVLTVGFDPPLTARGVSVVITLATDLPTIYELQVFNDPQGQIKGTVKNASGGAVADAAVVSGDLFTITDDQGAYTLWAEPGTYDLTITKPDEYLGHIARGIAVTADATATADVTLQPVPTEPDATNLALDATATASSSWDDTGTYDAPMANDDDPLTRWNSAAGDEAGSWIALTWDSPQTFSKVIILEAFDRIRDYSIQIPGAGEEWTTIYRAEVPALPADVDRTVVAALAEPISVSAVRLLFNRVVTVPSIYEIQVVNVPVAVVRGTVKAAGTDTPIAGAQIKMLPSGPQLTTDATGSFAGALGRVEFDEYSFTATAEGYEPSAPQFAPVTTAQAVNLTFTLTPSGPAPGVKGDVDGNGQVAILDVVVALRIVAGLAEATPANLAGGDLNGNGRIEITEVVQILRAVAGLAPL